MQRHLKYAEDSMAKGVAKNVASAKDCIIKTVDKSDGRGTLFASHLIFSVQICLLTTAHFYVCVESAKATSSTTSPVLRSWPRSMPCTKRSTPGSPTSRYSHQLFFCLFTPPLKTTTNERLTSCRTPDSVARSRGRDAQARCGSGEVDVDVQLQLYFDHPGGCSGRQACCGQARSCRRQGARVQAPRRWRVPARLRHQVFSGHLFFFNYYHYYCFYFD